MRPRALAAGAGLALLTPVLAALLGPGWLLNGWMLAGAAAGFLAGGSMRRGFGYGAGSGLLALVVTVGVSLFVWVGSLLGLFGQEFARGAVHLSRGSFMMGWFAVFALPLLALAVVFVLVAMGVVGAAGAAARSF